MAARLTQIDYDREMALVALEDKSDSPTIAGVVRIAADPDNVRAEYAILVRSDLKGHGLGWALMKQIIAYARSRGLKEIFGEVLTENVHMLRMAEQLGFTIRSHPEDAGLMTVAVDLTKL
jgi:acetyltransferase